jgi:NitT/TauT family transport system substrate-binding protein
MTLPEPPPALRRAVARFGLGGALGALALVLALAGVAAYWRFAPSTSDRPVALAPMTMCMSLSIGVLPALALADGEFAALGLGVTLVHFATGRDALAAMLDRKCELATSAETPIVLAAFDRSELRILTTTSVSHQADRIVTRKRSGIRSIADLRGKRVGLVRNTSSAYFFDRLLIAGNIDRHSVTVMLFESPATLTDALVHGDGLDAVATWQPVNWEIMRQLGDDGAEFSAPGVHLQTGNLATRNNVLAGRQADLRALLRALLRAEENAARDPVRAKAAIARTFDRDQAATDELWASAGEFRVALTQAFLLQLEDEARWAVGDRLVRDSMRPNFLDVIATASLLAVAPDRVTIYRVAHDHRR